MVTWGSFISRTPHMYSWEGFGSEIGGLWLRTLANIVKLAQLGGRVSQHNTNIEPHPTCCFCMIGWLRLSSSQQIVFIWVWSCSICICINMNMLRVKGEQNFCPKWDSVRLNHEPTCWIIPTITTWFLLEHLQVALADWVNPHMESNTCHKENLRWTPMFWRWCSAAVWLKDVQKLRPGNEHHSIRRKIHRIFPQRSTVKRVFKSGFYMLWSVSLRFAGMVEKKHRVNHLFLQTPSVSVGFGGKLWWGTIKPPPNVCGCGRRNPSVLKHGWFGKSLN